MAHYGTGMLFAQPEYKDSAPIERNWINRAGTEDFSRLIDYRDDFQPGARRFDMGEKANPPLLVGVATAAAMLLDWGVGRIAEALGLKKERITASATQMGWQVAAKSD